MIKNISIKKNAIKKNDNALIINTNDNIKNNEIINKEIIDKFYLNKALMEAKKAYKNGDIPVGCVIVYNENKNNTKMFARLVGKTISSGDVLSSGYNKRNKLNDATKHAEIIAISKACKKINDFRLEECTMYVTLEPCQMCAGAIVQSRIKRLVIGAKSHKAGSCGSIIDILDNNEFNHKVIVDFVNDITCENILKDFFKDIRKNAKK